MSVTTRVSLLAGAAALTFASASSARPAEGQDDMAKRLAAAEAKIAELQAQGNQNWLTEQRAAEIKGLVQDVLADADTRASLLQAGMTSGYDNGMVVGSSDGNWLLRPNFLTQQRFWKEEGAQPDTRVSLLQAGMTSGPDNGMVLGSHDDEWLVNVSFVMQHPFTWKEQDQDNDDLGIPQQNEYGVKGSESHSRLARRTPTARPCKRKTKSSALKKAPWWSQWTIRLMVALPPIIIAIGQLISHNA